MADTFWTLAGASLKAVTTVGACAGVGAYAHKSGFLDAKAQKAVDKLIAEIFLPCLILSKVTPNMQPKQLLAIWPLAAMCILMVVFGLCSGWLASRCLMPRYPAAFPKYRGLIMVALAFPNSFSVPMTLLLAVGPHPALVGDSGLSADELQTRVAMLFLLSYAVWVLARWSIGYPILTGALTLAEWRKKVLNAPVKACLLALLAGLLWDAATRFIAPGSGWSTKLQFLYPFSTALQYAGRCTVPLILFALGARLRQAVGEVRESATSKPVDKPMPEVLGLRVVDDGASNESLDADVEAEALQPDSDEEPEDAKLPLMAYPVVLFVRQFLGPAISALIAIGFLRGLCGVNDRVVLMVGMLQGAGPPMINLSVMAGLTGNAEMETSKLLLVTYGFSIITWTLSISVFLWLLG